MPGCAQYGTGSNTKTPALICLKGGDLSIEIQESAISPNIIEITELFPEEYFNEKYLLHVPRKK